MLPALYGHEGIRRRLADALAAGRLPQALLFEGPRGVGKQRLALWLAQAVVCERSAPRLTPGEPCGACASCKMVLNLAHPDVHWFVPLEGAKRSGDAEKQVELVEDALIEEMAARRAAGTYESAAGLASHGIASVRLLLRRLARTPALAQRKVFIVGDAERLVPQVGAEAAANALLKALEEPPEDTVFLLTAGEPEALLPTLLSRVVRVRVPLLADSIVAAFAQRELGLSDESEVAQRVAAADGRIGKLLASEEARAGGAAAAGRFRAAVSGGAVSRYAFALGQQPFQARGGFTAMLDGLVEQLRHEARAGRDTERVVAAIAAVLEARGLAQGNVNPQLVAAVLGDDLGGGAGAPA